MKLRDTVDAVKVPDTGCCGYMCILLDEAYGNRRFQFTFIQHAFLLMTSLEKVKAWCWRRSCLGRLRWWCLSSTPGLPSVPLTHLHLFIYPSLCFSASFLHLASHLIPLTSEATLILWIIFKPKYCISLCACFPEWLEANTNLVIFS